MAPQTAARQLNGIDVDRLGETIEGVKQSPSIAKFTFRAHNRQIEGVQARTTIHDFYGALEERQHARSFEVTTDEPDVLLGTDQGPGATEMVLLALAACLNGTLIYHATAKGIRIDGVEMEIEGDVDIQGFLGLSPDVRNGFQQIRVRCRLQSEASREQQEELLALAQRRSPVFDIVSHGVPVKLELE